MKLTSPKALATFVVFMFAFGFMMVPIYDVFCEITGLNGKTAGQYTGEVTAVDSEEINRTVTIQFIANRNENLPWHFSPEQDAIKLVLGERQQTSFQVINTYDKDVVAQAIPSVSPSEAAPYLHKIECFCFQQQLLAAGEEKSFPLVFFIDSELPENISKLTLAYTLFDITSSQTVGM